MLRPNLAGWRPSPPDFRDAFYTAPLAVLLSLPSSVDLRNPAPSGSGWPIWDQGNLGRCGPVAIAGDLLWDLLSRAYPSPPMPSWNFIYYVARQIMGTVNEDSGVYNRALLQALNKTGWCDESVWPSPVGSFKVKPSVEAFAQAAERKVKDYKAVSQNLAQMKACLASRDPFLFGFSCYSSMFNEEVERTGVIPMPSGRDSLEGGHDVLFCGYDDSRNCFLFRNSWGTGWGMSGYGWMPYAYATSSGLAGDFWTVQRTAMPTPPTPPVPPGPIPPAIGEIQIDLAARTYAFPADWTPRHGVVGITITEEQRQLLKLSALELRLRPNWLALLADLARLVQDAQAHDWSAVAADVQQLLRDLGVLDPQLPPTVQ